MKKHPACLSREKVLNSLFVLRIVLHILETSLKSRNLGDGPWQWAWEHVITHANRLRNRIVFNLSKLNTKGEVTHSQGALTEGNGDGNCNAGPKSKSKTGRREMPRSGGGAWGKAYLIKRCFIPFFFLYFC